MFVNSLTVDSVIKSYNNEKILSDISFNCKTNEIIGVFGRNGSGKSTLLKIIFGTEQCENKFIKINNKVNKKIYLEKNDISYLTQESFIPRNLMVQKVIKLFIDKNLQNEFLDDEILMKIKHEKVKKLSGGELRYLEIKLILYLRTKFSFLDEPFSGLSPIQIEKVKKLIIESSKLKGIVIIDHQYQYVLDIATKLYLMKNQKLILLKNTQQLVDYGYLSDNNII